MGFKGAKYSDAVNVQSDMGGRLAQSPRVSFTFSYKGLIVGGPDGYHPEKVDISMTKTIDYIEGESKEETRQRLEDLKVLEQMLVHDVQASVIEKVKLIKSKGKKV